MTRPEDPRSSTPTATRRTPLRILAGLAIGVVVLAAAATAVRPMLRPALDPVQPARDAALDEQVELLLAEHVENVQRKPRDATAHGHLGLVYEANEMYTLAEQAFANATRLDRGEPLWRLHRAVALRQVGDLDEAVAMLRAAAGDAPDDAAIQHRLGIMLLDAGEIDEAERAFDRTIELAPRMANGYVGLGEVRLRQQRPEEAAELLEQAVRLDGTDRMARFLLGTAYQRLGRQTDADAFLRQGADAEPMFVPDAMTPFLQKYAVNLAAQLDRAAMLAQSGRPGEAAAILERALAQRPNDVNVLNNLASAYRGLGQTERARRMLNRAARLAPDEIGVQINLAGAMLELDRPAEAMRHAERSLEIDRQSGQAHYVRGRVLVAMERWDEAAAAFEQAIRRDVSTPDAYVALAELYFRLERYDQSRENYELATKLFPNLLPAHVSLASVCMRLGRLDEADQALEAARRLAPRHPRVLAAEEQLMQLRGR